jgi:hypothetical protein
MGLGKTLTMIALAATDLSMSSLQGQPLKEDDLDDHKRPVLATLIIVPPPRKYMIQSLHTQMR